MPQGVVRITASTVGREEQYGFEYEPMPIFNWTVWFGDMEGSGGNELDVCLWDQEEPPTG